MGSSLPLPPTHTHSVFGGCSLCRRRVDALWVACLTIGSSVRLFIVDGSCFFLHQRRGCPTPRTVAPPPRGGKRAGGWGRGLRTLRSLRQRRNDAPWLACVTTASLFGYCFYFRVLARRKWVHPSLPTQCSKCVRFVVVVVTHYLYPLAWPLVDLLRCVSSRGLGSLLSSSWSRIFLTRLLDHRMVYCGACNRGQWVLWDHFRCFQGECLAITPPMVVLPPTTRVPHSYAHHRVCLSSLRSPYRNFRKFQTELGRHLNRASVEYVVDGIRDGFRTGLVPESVPLVSEHWCVRCSSTSLLRSGSVGFQVLCGSSDFWSPVQPVWRYFQEELAGQVALHTWLLLAHYIIDSIATMLEWMLRFHCGLFTFNFRNHRLVYSVGYCFSLRVFLFYDFFVDVTRLL